MPNVSTSILAGWSSERVSGLGLGLHPMNPRPEGARVLPWVTVAADSHHPSTIHLVQALSDLLTTLPGSGSTLGQRSCAAFNEFPAKWGARRMPSLQTTIQLITRLRQVLSGLLTALPGPR